MSDPNTILDVRVSNAIVLHDILPEEIHLHAEKCLSGVRGMGKTGKNHLKKWLERRGERFSDTCSMPMGKCPHATRDMNVGELDEEIRAMATQMADAIRNHETEIAEMRARISRMCERRHRLLHGG